MGHIEDRWFKEVEGPGGKKCRVKTNRHGTGQRYRVRYIAPDGTERSKSFPDRARKAAEEFLNGVEADKSRGTYVDPQRGKRPFADLAESWVRTARFDASTRYGVRTRVRAHLIPFFRNRAVNSIRPSLLREWDVWLIGKGLAEGHRAVLFAHLSGIMTAAVDDGLIPKNPCSAKSVKRPHQHLRKVTPWPVSRVSAIRAELGERYRPVVDIGAGCGARQGEIFGLSPDDFDVEGGWLDIRRQVKMVGSRMVFGLPKNDKERRTPLPDSVARAIRDYPVPAVAVTLPWEDPDHGSAVTFRLVFTTPYGNAINRNTFNTWNWRPALKRLGIQPSPETGMHALRHFFASTLLDAGESIKAIAEWLGHSDPAFTLRVYTHLMSSSQGRARGAIDALFEEFGHGHGPGTARRGS
ncbi:tyrosine-type recombinase/integrase [Actinoplanes awajinensis]|uniref:Integrase n=1 Tax=Actinoplanes awajinensis subsp. mycoplanecinus TaxID=135947 RepID=A0A0X3V7T3_9ACTN|nr:site-specific integrase [Actinoplanes awajinensis]KUL40768.1 hypothetical protein ADL15_05960 [Actinoplanes awajinensis subsp. mycoplanecinus]